MTDKKLIVALADDDADDRLLFKEAIGEIEVETKTIFFENGVELMAFLENEENTLPHLVFLDLNMPLMNGVECLEAIKSNPRLKNIIIAIYSTSSTERHIEETFVRGANIYIEKPSSYNTLKGMVDKVLRMNWQYHFSNLNRENFLLKL